MKRSTRYGLLEPAFAILAALAFWVLGLTMRIPLQVDFTLLAFTVALEAGLVLAWAAYRAAGWLAGFIDQAAARAHRKNPDVKVEEKIYFGEWTAELYGSGGRR